MAKASLLGLLACALSVQLGGACLRCWPDAAAYFRYDAHLLLGDAKAADMLEKLFLGSPGDHANYGGSYLEREHMEREAGTLFLRLEKIIQKSGKDHERLMKEAEQEKQNFIEQLKEAYKAFLKESQSRFQPYEVAQCTNCRVLKASCNDAIICAGPNVLAAVFVTFVLLLILGVAMWYYRHKKKAKGEAKEEEAKEDGGKDESSSESSETSEWSDDTAPNSPVYYNVPGPTKSSNPEPVYENIRQSPKYENIPSPPELDIPKPPKSNISKESPIYENIPSPP
ncbi:testis-expressed protein 51 isoform X2 [Hemicordylus capensis]|uniref:testis-expressed protein 51 isoform X2 n=1 Tax=Hemicordylus capensis TaxID=884348 RepID=UPI002303BBB3|nr:testis-expressed protein 51 isoform X2 [Hemicordylus capensis]